jgi:4-oxalocrotonate tautomerase
VVRALIRRARARVTDSLAAVLLASIAAALAWWVARDVLGHPEPFFAPTSAAISLTTSRVEPSARIGQMVGGVLLGILIGEVLSGLIGSSPLALGVIALVAMMSARALGGGFLGEGVFFVNQTVGSAILVVAIHRAGTGTDRAVDALVGGTIAYLLSALLLPVSPLDELADARRGLTALVQRRSAQLEDVERLDRARRQAWVLDTWHELERALDVMSAACQAAHLNARAVPRWWRRRSAVDAEIAQSTELALSATSEFGLMRVAALNGKNPPPRSANDGSLFPRPTGGRVVPVTRIAIRKGKPSEYKQALMDEIYEAMRETVAIQDGDRFMAITEHGEDEFAYGSFLGIERSDDLVQLQVFWAPGKSVQAKLAMYRRIVERLASNPGVRPEDVLISVVETAAENWSFGNGETQFYQPPVPEPARA